MDTPSSLKSPTFSNGGDPTANNVSAKQWGTCIPFPLPNNSVYRQFYKMFQDGLDKGIQKDCFATKFFAVADDFGFDQDQQMFVAGTLIEAGITPLFLTLGLTVRFRYHEKSE
jgi:hypothetical protein